MSQQVCQGEQLKGVLLAKTGAKDTTSPELSRSSAYKLAGPREKNILPSRKEKVEKAAELSCKSGYEAPDWIDRVPYRTLTDTYSAAHRNR